MDFLLGLIARDLAREKSKANFEYSVPESGPQPGDEVKKGSKFRPARLANGLNRPKLFNFFKPASTLRDNKECDI